MSHRPHKTLKGDILIVDDCPENLSLLALMLNKHGYTTHLASSGFSALQRVRECPPDLILLDAMMPSMDGYSVCRALKVQEQFRDIPIIFVSALQEAEHKVKAFSVGAADFVSKPFKVTELIARIEYQLRLVRLQQQLNQQTEQLTQQNQQLQREIYERKCLEAALKASENELRGLFAAIQDVVLVLDAAGNYLKVAPTNSGHLLYRSVHKLEGKTLHETFPKQDADGFLQQIRLALSIQTTIDYEYSLVIGDRTIWFSAKISPISADSVIWVARDITDRKLFELEILEKSQSLSTFSRSLKQLHHLQMQDFQSFETLFKNFILSGCQILGFSAGAVGQVYEQTYTFLAVQSEYEDLIPNLTVNLEHTFCSKVVESNSTVAFQHVQEIPEMRCHPLYQSLKLESYLGTPIFAQGELFGTLCFFSNQPRVKGFEQHEVEIIELMAQSIGKYLSAHQSDTKRRQAEEEVQLLLNLTQAIAAAPDFNQALETALQNLCEATGWSYGQVWLPSADGQVLECSPIWHYGGDGEDAVAIAAVEQFRQSWNGMTCRPGEGIAGRIWHHQQAEWVPNIYPRLETRGLDADLETSLQVMVQGGFRAYFGVPVAVVRDRSFEAAPSIGWDGQSPAQGSLLAVLVFFMEAAQPQDQRFTELVPGLTAQLGTVLLQKQVEAALQDSEARFRTIVEQAAVGIFLTDITGQFIRVNQQFCGILGYTEFELLNLTFQAVIHPEDQIVSQMYFQQVLDGTHSGEALEIHCVCKQGQSRWINLTLSRMPYATDGSAYLIAVAEDIQERKQIEADLQEAKESAMREAARSADANRTKSDFLANISHELRTPLNAILGFTQLLTRETACSPKTQEYLDIISRSGEHLLDLINDVLELSKIEAGRSSLKLNPFDLHYFLRELEDMLRLNAEVKGLQFLFDYGSDVPHYVEADEGKLRQVLINLLGNAIKFTSEGGVTLRVRLENAVGSGTLRAPFTLLFEVEDTGIGIAPMDLETLFDPFVQSKHRTHQQEGTGLGLPISQKFVELMGGNIHVVSVSGRGTLCRFGIQAFPAPVVDSPPMPQQRAIALLPDQAPHRILVVDDHAPSRQLLVDLLRTIGFDVQEATNGQDAIAQWQQWSPHLVWMDMRMPLVDGYEATRQIRAAEAQRSKEVAATKIIAVTASAFEEDRARVLAAGCDDFVRKPFRDGMILEKMATHLGVRYRYAPTDRGPMSPPCSHQVFPLLDTTTLQFMPSEWIQKVHQAAVRGSDEQLLQLLEQIPEDYPTLIQVLRNWVLDYQFDRILALTQGIAP